MSSMSSSAQIKPVNQQAVTDIVLNKTRSAHLSGRSQTTESKPGGGDRLSATTMIDQLANELRHGDTRTDSPVSVLTRQLTGLYRLRQHELEERETLTNRLSTLLNALPAGVVVIDARGLVQESNPAAIELLGEPLIGQRWVDIISRSFSPRADDGHEVSLKDGRRLSIQTRSLDGGFGQLILLSDLTETRTLQASLARHQRLSAMGKTVASLAHQIRTPLSAAMLFAENLCTPDISPQLRIKCANKLISRLGHLEQQVRDMLLFAKGDSPTAEKLSVQQLLGEVKIATDSLVFSRQVSFVWDIPTLDQEIVGNKDALVGAVMNLINNASEAALSKPSSNRHQLKSGPLTTAAPSNSSQPVLPEMPPMPEVKVSLKLSQDHMAIVVADNGVGFESIQGTKLMEAFYTTKSNGTGLGLAVVQNVAKAHQGHFLIASKGEGHGAEAIISLPLHKPDSPDLSKTEEKA